MLKKILKYFFGTLVLLIALLNVYILITGNFYVYKVFQYTIFKGKMGPDINEFTKDNLGVVEKGSYIPIPNSQNYNKKKPSGKFYTLSKETGTTAFVVLKNDSVLYEEYFEGIPQDSISNSFSMSKSIVGLLVGCAIKEGKIKSVDEPISNYLPDFDPESKGKITIKHLLTMSSSISFNESYINPFGFAAEALYGNNLKELIYRYKLEGEPGKNFDYQSGNTQLLCFILEKATGMNIYTYASNKIWKNIGAQKNALWCLDKKNGEARAFCCFNSNAKDFSRLGQLMLHNGNYNGIQIIDTNYVKATTKAAKIFSDNLPNNKYGYHWWLINYKGEEIFYARGILGQYIFCIPSKKIVAVRLGHKRSKEKINDHPADVYIYLEEALNLN